MVNVGKYTIHGWYGIVSTLFVTHVLSANPTPERAQICTTFVDTAREISMIFGCQDRFFVEDFGGIQGTKPFHTDDKRNPAPLGMYKTL